MPGSEVAVNNDLFIHVFFFFPKVSTINMYYFVNQRRTQSTSYGESEEGGTGGTGPLTNMTSRVLAVCLPCGGGEC